MEFLIISSSSTLNSSAIGAHLKKVSELILNNLWSITSAFLVHRLRPLYVAWFIYMIRFYVIPLSLGYGVMGVLSLPLESEISLAIYDLLDLLTTKVD